MTHGALNSEPSRHLQFTWVPLPEQDGSVSTGAIFQSPWTSDNRSRIVIGCAIHAQWIPTQIHTNGYSFWQGWYPKDVSWGEAYSSSGHLLFNGSTAPDEMDAITVDEGWLVMLTPPAVQGQPGGSPSTNEVILDRSHLTDDLFDSHDRTSIELWQDEKGSRTQLLVSITGSVFNDGLARVGIKGAFDHDGAPSRRIPLSATNPSSYNTQEYRVEFSISGLSCRLTIVQELAATVLLLHISIVLANSAWIILYTGESSGCWDTVTELVVLAQNSRPTFYALSNIAAGIKHSSTFAKKVSIRPTKPPNDGGPEHLEIVFEADGIHQGDGETREVHDNNTNGAVLRSRNMIHSSTWQVHRPQKGTSPSGSMEHSNCDEPTPDTPLMDIDAADTFDLLLADRVRVGHAYG